jgi:hypothetical protein
LGVRPGNIEEIVHLLGIGQVPIVEKEPDIRQMRVLIEMIDPAAVEAARAADEAVHLVTLVEEEFGQIRAVLAGDSREQGFFHRLPPLEKIRLFALNFRLLGRPF